MGELLARSFTEQALLDAWADARDAALADGVAGPEVDQFEVGAARRISQLAESLADGTFTPGPLVRVDIAKPAGDCAGWRCPPWQTGSWNVRCWPSWTR